MKFHILFILSILSPFHLYSQINSSYQKPPKEILDLIAVDRVPSTYIDDNGKNIILIYRDQFKSLEELSQKEMRLAGLRINPKRNIHSRTRFYKNIKIKKTHSNHIQEIKGLPQEKRYSGFTWSPNQKYMTFLNTTSKGNELWVIDIENFTAKKLTNPIINANLGNAINWFKDNQRLLIKVTAKNSKSLINSKTTIPSGPTITVSDGKKAQNRTYQDLLKNKNDEYNFELLTTSEIYEINLSGKFKKWQSASMVDDIVFSPNGQYVRITHIQRPFSYIVPYSRFPSETIVYDLNGKKIKTVSKTPLTEVLPKGFMAVRKGKRNMAWRNDKPSTLYWTEALDDGDPKNKVKYRDIVYQLDVPFTEKPKQLIKTKNRCYKIIWGQEDTAIAYDYWWNNRNQKAYLFNPSNLLQTPVIIEDRNYQDRYSEPGDLVTHKNKYSRDVLTIKNDHVYLMGEGFTPKGQFPFIDKQNLKTLKKQRIYQSTLTKKMETLSKAIDIKKGSILVRLQSPTEYPNYHIRNIFKKSLTPLTNFKNPFESLKTIHKELITYKRDDGLELNGTLYLPVKPHLENHQKYPLLIWAYPREYKNKKSAAQKTNNPNKFTYPSYGSPIFWVKRGYAVLDKATFPIVGEGNKQPNDTFRSQLIANAKAAIDTLDKRGLIDRNRVAIGGHSYGAFMVANLLSHSKLFAAGIARSGAYNRTLTPFGFQREERSYWEAPNVYYSMSPFMHADKMKTPLLLIHGAADNNAGTYPLQSERYFNALKGLGATARLVMLPKESHGYRAKESILHMLWEQDRWLDKYVKQKR